MNRRSVLAVLVVSALIFGAGWTAQGWRKDVVIAGLKREHAAGQATDATEALDQFKDTAATVAKAASSAQAANDSAAKVFLAIRKEMSNAKPLPADCKPDADRLRNRNAAIEAYNRAAAGSLPGAAVPDR